MEKSKIIYKVNVYDGGLSSVHELTIYTGYNKASAYAKLEEYLQKHPECCKAYIDEVRE